MLSNQHHALVMQLEQELDALTGLNVVECQPAEPLAGAVAEHERERTRGQPAKDERPVRDRYRSPRAHDLDRDVVHVCDQYRPQQSTYLTCSDL